MRLFGVSFQNPVLLAAGSCGFGRELSRATDLEILGGMVTKSVTLLERRGNPRPRITEWRSAMINSVGLANPGLDRVRCEYLPWIARNLGRPHVFVSVAGSTAREFSQLVAGLDEEDGFLGFELNLSCPNALTNGERTIAHDPTAIFTVLDRCRKITSRPLLAKLGPGLPDLTASLRAAQEAGADAITLFNSLPATDEEVRHHATRLGNGTGGLTGPPLRPHVIAGLRVARRTVHIPLIATGGVATAGDALRFRRAGASLVQICTAAFADPSVAAKVVRGLGSWEAS